MPSLSRQARRRWLACLLLCTFPLLSHAGLVRSGGGSVQQDTDVNYIYLMSDDNIVADGLVHSISDYVSTQSLPSTRLDIYATPPQDCYHNITFTQEGEFRTDCRWEFMLGEMIAVQGAVTTYLAGSLIEFFWTIVGPEQSWTFTGDDVTFDGTNVFMNAAMPSNMTVGEYRIDFTFRQTAPEDHFFLYRTRFESGGCYDEELNICGYFGDFSETLTYSTSARFTVVDAPSALLLSLFGVGLVWRRRTAR